MDVSDLSDTLRCEHIKIISISNRIVGGDRNQFNPLMNSAANGILVGPEGHTGHYGRYGLYNRPTYNGNQFGQGSFGGAFPGGPQGNGFPGNGLQGNGFGGNGFAGNGFGGNGFGGDRFTGNGFAGNGFPGRPQGPGGYFDQGIQPFNSKSGAGIQAEEPNESKDKGVAVKNPKTTN